MTPLRALREVSNTVSSTVVRIFLHDENYWNSNREKNLFFDSALESLPDAHVMITSI